MNDLKRAFDKYFEGCRAEFMPLEDMKVRWIRNDEQACFLVSDIFEEAPQNVLEEIAERLHMAIYQNLPTDFVGPHTRRFISDNLSNIRRRLQNVTESIELEDVDDWQIWVSDRANSVQVRELTKIVVAPRIFQDSPDNVRDWLRECAREHRRTEPSKDVYDWLWDSGLI